MNSALTVRDLLLPGEPLDPADVLAGHGHLSNPVSWVASLRPYPPAFPRLRGGELALVAVDFMARLDPPTTLSDVVRQLVSRGASGLAVRGPVDVQAIEAANAGSLPLLQLASDAPLPDIEQAIMRACALYQARREMLAPEEPDSWVEDLLTGRITSQTEVVSLARRSGTRLASSYSVAYAGVMPQGSPASSESKLLSLASSLEMSARAAASPLLTQRWDEGLTVLIPQDFCERAIRVITESGLPCGIGREGPVVEASRSLSEARLAEIDSALLSNCKPVYYDKLGADRLLLLLYRDQPAALRAFVDDALGPLLSRDAGSATPLLPTLESFVFHGGRLRETASDIYVHRNTLAYRLDRAAEILGIDLKDAQTRMSIELALRALPLVRAMNDGGLNGR